MVNAAELARNPELARSSVVVVAQPGFKPGQNSGFFWAENHADISPGFRRAGFNVQSLLDQAISGALMSKHYAFKAAQGELRVRYHLSLHTEMDDTALAMQYGLAPGLRANSELAKKFQRGTLVVDFIQPSSQGVVWRGAISVFIGLEDTDTGREKRVAAVVNELFSSIPEIKSAAHGQAH